MHPIFENGIQYSGKTKEMVDITASEENLDMIRSEVKEAIEQAQDLMEVYLIIRGSYRLTFLKFIKNYLSPGDFGKLLADAWVNSENPNQDKNVSIAMAARWFRKADKTTLMTPEDYEVYKNLPDKVVVYRGVAVGRNPKGLSWTASYKKAKWFANRFNREDKSGYIQKAIADKKDILAYFNTRDEDELVIYPNLKLIQKKH
jgi:hypothetical protein